MLFRFILRGIHYIACNAQLLLQFSPNLFLTFQVLKSWALDVHVFFILYNPDIDFFSLSEFKGILDLKTSNVYS